MGSSARQMEIIEEIVDTLRPWKKHSRVAITAEVRKALDLTCSLISLEERFFDRAEMRAYAKRLDAALSEVETLSESPPGVLGLFLLFPRPIVPGEKTSSQERATETFLAELKRLRKICAQAIAPGFGSHPKFDHAKFRCAFLAKALMGNLSKNKATGTEDAPFRVITTLFYEAVSGQPGADLKRACDDVLRNFRD
jgi:hypothetical protein